MGFGGDFGSVFVEKNVWPFLMEKMGSPLHDPLVQLLTHLKTSNTNFICHRNFFKMIWISPRLLFNNIQLCLLNLRINPDRENSEHILVKFWILFSVFRQCIFIPVSEVLNTSFCEYEIFKDGRRQNSRFSERVQTSKSKLSTRSR